MHRKVLTLGMIIPLATAGAVSTASAAPTARVASFHTNPVQSGSCDSKSTITLNVTPSTGPRLIVAFVIRDPDTSNRFWEAKITQREATGTANSLRPTFDIKVLSGSKGTARGQFETKGIGSNDNQFKIKATNTFSGERCSTTWVVQGS